MSVDLIAGVNKHAPKLYDEYVERGMPSLQDHGVDALAISSCQAAVPLRPREAETPFIVRSRV